MEPFFGVKQLRDRQICFAFLSWVLHLLRIQLI